MIGRIWKGVVPAERADEYLQFLHKTGFKDYRATEGNRGVLALKRIEDGKAEFTLITLWDSYDAIRRFAGDDVEKAHYYPEDDDFLLWKEPNVTHYEVVESFDPTS